MSVQTDGQQFSKMQYVCGLHAVALLLFTHDTHLCADSYAAAAVCVCLCCTRQLHLPHRRQRAWTTAAWLASQIAVNWPKKIRLHRCNKQVVLHALWVCRQVQPHKGHRKHVQWGDRVHYVAAVASTHNALTKREMRKEQTEMCRRPVAWHRNAQVSGHS